MPSKPTWTLAIHGGAGGLPSDADAAYISTKLQGLQQALYLGAEKLQSGASAIDVVQQVVQAFEDNPAFNAGRGSVLDYNGNVSMDASIMDGCDLSCGAVANVTQVRNPVALARFVRDHTPHVILSGSQADALAIEAGIAIKSREYFLTDEQQIKWIRWKEREQSRRQALQSKPDASSKSKPKSHPGKNPKGGATDSQIPPDDDGLFRLSTVGCVASDSLGNLAAATSTGGLIGKQYGRVGDSPIIGAGTYAKNKVCAISCTGVGEIFIKHCVASAIAARMELAGENLTTAMQHVLMKTLPKDSGGAIGVDSLGNAELVFNTPVMARGRANANGLFEIAIL